MSRSNVAAGAVVLLVLAGALASVGSAVATDGGGPDQLAVEDRRQFQGTQPVDAQQTNESAGERFAGAVGRERATVVGQFRRTSFERAYDAAGSDADGARVAGDYRRRAERHLDAVAARRDALRERRAAGELSAGAYRAHRRQLRAEAEAVVELVVAIRNRTADLPAELRADHGVTEAALDSLAADARSVRDSLPDDASGRDVYGEIDRFLSEIEGRTLDGGLVADRLTGERVTLVVRTADGRAVVSFTIDDDGTVEDVAAGAHANPTLRISTDRVTLTAVATAADPGRRLRRAVREGDVELRGVGTLKRLEWGAVELAAELT